MARALGAAMGDPGSSGETATGAAPVAPLGAASGFRRPRSRLPFVAAALLLAVGGAAAWWGARRAASPAASARSFLVAPFAVLSGEPSLAWLREGSVSMLTMDLAQWTDLSVVGYERTLDLLRDAGLDGAAPVSLSEAQALARRGGAGSVVTGQVTASPDSLRVAASLYDVASGTLRRQLQVAAPLGGDPRDLFDVLARQLLEIAGAPPITPELARTTTSSLAAYQAYLQGVRALNSWQLARADSLLGAAVAADSTFALAHYKRALARGWSHYPDSTDVRFAETALRHAGRLGRRERDLAEGYLAVARGLAAIPRDTAGAAGYLAAAEERYAALLARDTLDAESWYGLGDALFHRGQLDGRLSANWTRAMRAFDRTLALDSSFHLAYSHKLLVYQAASTAGSPLVVVGDSLLYFPSDTAARRYGAARIEAARAAARRLAVEQGGHWVASDPDAPTARVALAEAHAAAGDYARAAQVLRQALDRPAAATADMPYRIAAYEMAAGSGRALPTLRAALADGADSLVGGDPLGRGVAIVSAANAASRAGARQDVERLLDLRARTDPMLPFAGLPTARLVPVWRATLLLAMGVDDATVRRDADRAIADMDAVPGDYGRMLRQQLATLPFTAFLQRGDTSYLAVLRRWTGRETSPELRILAALDRGDSAQANELAAQLAPPDTAVAVGAQGATLRQFARAELYIALGDARQALRTYEAIDPLRFAAVTPFPDPRWALHARSFLVRGQLHEQLGQAAEAARAYERFLELWRDADPAFASQLRTAREGLARVRRGNARG
jgi:tetratricopeptide (TPR) repeat protein